MEKKRDAKMIAGMAGLILVFVLAAGAFWTAVIYQSQKVQEDEGEYISAIYVVTEGILKMQVFVDIEQGTIFTAPIPDEGIYSEDDKPVSGDVLENGDMVKIYGDGIMAESFPGQYNGVTKIRRNGRASEETIEEYTDMVEGSFRGIIG